MKSYVFRPLKSEVGPRRDRATEGSRRRCEGIGNERAKMMLCS
jgi:hypothetical protein